MLLDTCSPTFHSLAVTLANNSTASESLKVGDGYRAIRTSSHGNHHRHLLTWPFNNLMCLNIEWSNVATLDSCACAKTSNS